MSLVHDRRGSGPPLVLVHGHGAWRWTFKPVAERLAARHEVIAVDLPGFGETPPDGTAPTVEGYATRLESFFGELGLERPAVAGFSMGGGIALELARRGAVASAVALCPIGFWTPQERRWSQTSLRRARRVCATTPRPLLERLVRSPLTRTILFAQLFGRPWRLDPEQTLADIGAQVGAPLFEEALDAFDRHRFRDPDELRATGIPVTVAWGSRDALLIPRQHDRAKRMLPWARHVTLHGCGHVPFADDPQLVASAVIAGSDPD